MNEDELKEGEGQAEMPKPNYDADPNVKARRRAAKRSDNQKKGKALDEGIVAEAKTEEAAPEELPASPEVEGEEGGIVAEAKEEEAIVEAASEDKAEVESEAPEAESPAEEASESPAKEASESPAEEAAEPMMDEVGEYAAPEGPAHDELIDQYHEALAFGDLETAKALYKQLQDHRFKENTHRAKSEAQAEQEVKAYVATATELAAKYPELAEDGLPATKVMALSDVYRQEGMSAADALRKAVADLYPESGTEAPTTEPMMETAPEEVPAEPEMVAEEPAAPAEEEGMIPDMTERKAAKRSIPAMPSASARNEPAPPPKAPTRSDAIQQMKEKRGQA